MINNKITKLKTSINEFTIFFGNQVLPILTISGIIIFAYNIIQFSDKSDTIEFPSSKYKNILYWKPFNITTFKNFKYMDRSDEFLEGIKFKIERFKGIPDINSTKILVEKRQQDIFQLINILRKISYIRQDKENNIFTKILSILKLV